MPVFHCDNLNELYTSYLEGELTSEQRAEFDQHLDSCARCAQDFRFFQSVMSEARALEPIAPPAAMRSNIHARLADRKLPWHVRLVNVLRQPAYSLSLAGAAACGLLLFMATQRGMHKERDSVTARPGGTAMQAQSEPDSYADRLERKATSPAAGEEAKGDTKRPASKLSTPMTSQQPGAQPKPKSDADKTVALRELRGGPGSPPALRLRSGQAGQADFLSARAQGEGKGSTLDAEALADRAKEAPAEARAGGRPLAAAPFTPTMSQSAERYSRQEKPSRPAGPPAPGAARTGGAGGGLGAFGATPIGGAAMEKQDPMLKSKQDASKGQVTLQYQGPPGKPGKQGPMGKDTRGIIRPETAAAGQSNSAFYEGQANKKSQDVQSLYRKREAETREYALTPMDEERRNLSLRRDAQKENLSAAPRSQSERQQGYAQSQRSGAVRIQLFVRGAAEPEEPVVVATELSSPVKLTDLALQIESSEEVAFLSGDNSVKGPVTIWSGPLLPNDAMRAHVRLLPHKPGIHRITAVLYGAAGQVLARKSFTLPVGIQGQAAIRKKNE